MPNVSQAQRAAMAAAAAGNSTLGIPQSVGKEFMAADRGGKLPARASMASIKAEHDARYTYRPKSGTAQRGR